MRLENVLRAATLDRDESITGLIGVTKAIRINGQPANAKVSIEGGHAATAFVPANYSSSFRALGCGLWDEKRGAKLTDFGTSLALAFDKCLNSVLGHRSALNKLCSNAPEVSVGAIRSVAEAVRLRPVGPNEPEHKLLMELLLRMETIRDRVNAEYDLNRSRSLALLLEIAEQAQGTLSSSSDLHRIFATGQLANHHVFSVPLELEQSFEVWRRYQERQYIKLSVYALWHEVVQMLAYAPFKVATAQQLLSHFRMSLRKSELAEKWLGKQFDRQTIGEVMQSLSKQLSFKPRDFGKMAIELGETLRDLDRGSEDRVGAAIVLLLLCACYWKNNWSALPEAHLHKQGGIERLSLHAVSNDLDQLSDDLVADYLLWAVEAYVLKQSARIATQKLPDYRFFIIRDDEGYRLVKPQDPRSYLSYDSSRIGSAYDLMSGLKLVEMDGGIKLTPTGRKVLEKLRAFHESMITKARTAISA